MANGDLCMDSASLKSIADSLCSSGVCLYEGITYEIEGPVLTWIARHRDCELKYRCTSMCEIIDGYYKAEYFMDTRKTLGVDGNLEYGFTSWSVPNQCDVVAACEYTSDVYNAGKRRECLEAAWNGIGGQPGGTLGTLGVQGTALENCRLQGGAFKESCATRGDCVETDSCAKRETTATVPPQPSPALLDRHPVIVSQQSILEAIRRLKKRAGYFSSLRNSRPLRGMAEACDGGYTLREKRACGSLLSKNEVSENFWLFEQIKRESRRLSKLKDESLAMQEGSAFGDDIITAGAVGVTSGVTSGVGGVTSGAAGVGGGRGSASAGSSPTHTGGYKRPKREGGGRIGRPPKNLNLNLNQGTGAAGTSTSGGGGSGSYGIESQGETAGLGGDKSVKTRGHGLGNVNGSARERKRRGGTGTTCATGTIGVKRTRGGKRGASSAVDASLNPLDGAGNWAGARAPGKRGGPGRGRGRKRAQEPLGLTTSVFDLHPPNPLESLPLTALQGSESTLVDASARTCIVDPGNDLASPTTSSATLEGDGMDGLDVGNRGAAARVSAALKVLECGGGAYKMPLHGVDSGVLLGGKGDARLVVSNASANVNANTNANASANASANVTGRGAGTSALPARHSQARALQLEATSAKSGTNGTLAANAIEDEDQDLELDGDDDGDDGDGDYCTSSVAVIAKDEDHVRRSSRARKVSIFHDCYIPLANNEWVSEAFIGADKVAF